MNPELSFLMEFDLNRNGMIEEIKTEFNIIRLCMMQIKELDKEYFPMLDRIVVMPLRKLLCENSSVLYKVVPDLKLSPLTGTEIELDNKLKMIRPNLTVTSQDKWIPAKRWREQNIAWFDKTETDLPDMIPDFVYPKILNKIKETDKAVFDAMFEEKEVTYQGTVSKIHVRVDAADEAKNAVVFSMLKGIGYYDLSIFNFLKHISDKRGAHVDIGHSPVVGLVNSPITDGLTPVLCIALQTIWAVKHQVPELNDYWSEMTIPEE